MTIRHIFRSGVLGVAGSLALATSTAPSVWGQCQVTRLIDDTIWQGDDQYGSAVAVSGLRMVVGSPFDDNLGGFNQGSAFVFRRFGATLFPDGKLVALDANSGDKFGTSVSISGNFAIVGAVNKGNTNPNSVDGWGGAYIFRRVSDNTWIQEAALVGSDRAAGDAYGTSVAIDGDTAVVGARLHDLPGFANAGQAYVYKRSAAGVWTEQAKLTPGVKTLNGYYGGSVAISGSTIVVGAYSDNAKGQGSGAVYVYIPGAAGGWALQSQLTGSDTVAFDNLGISVAISGNSIVAGAWLNDGAGSSAGSAYVWQRSGAQWTQQGRFVASDAAANDWYANSVAISGDVALVGCARKAVGANGNQGAVYVYRRFGSAWTQQSRVIANDGAPVDFFGGAVALDSGVALVGAYLDDVNGLVNAGSAYVFGVAGPDCNGNNVPDLCDIKAGTAADANGNGVLDSCDPPPTTPPPPPPPPPCPNDVNHDGMVNSSDVGMMLGMWGTAAASADLNADGIVNSADLGLLLGAPWGTCH